MKWFKKSILLPIALLIILITSLAFALTSVEIKSHPDSTNSATVSDNKINILSTPYEDNISRGLISGKEDFNKFGCNSDVGTAIEDVWELGGTKTYLSSGEQLKILSDSASDDGDPVGVGARTIQILGLDDNYAEISETVTMNGVAAVTTAKTYLRLYRMKVITSGTSLSNVGTITIKNNAESVSMASIIPQYGQTLITHYTVPTDKRLLIKNLSFTATGTKDVTMFLFQRPFGESWQVKLAVTLNNGIFPRKFTPAFLVSSKSDLVIRAISTQAGGIVSGSWDSILEDE